MPEFRKNRPAHQKKAGLPQSPAKPRESAAEQAISPLLPELPKERLNAFDRLVFDANLCLNSYLDALKASSNAGKPHFENVNTKGIGAL